MFFLSSPERAYDYVRVIFFCPYLSLQEDKPCYIQPFAQLVDRSLQISYLKNF